VTILFVLGVVRPASRPRDEGCKPARCADWPVEGLLVHAAGNAPGGFRVVDVWESEEAARRFGETLGPILGEVGIEAQPELYPAHSFVSA